jgi:hypothetical protein
MAKKLKKRRPDSVVDIAAENVELEENISRDEDGKLIIGSFTRYVPANGVDGVIKLRTSVNNFGKTRTEIPVAELKFKLATWNKR